MHVTSCDRWHISCDHYIRVRWCHEVVIWVWMLLSDSSELRIVWQCSEEWLYRKIIGTLGGEGREGRGEGGRGGEGRGEEGEGGERGGKGKEGEGRGEGGRGGEGRGEGRGEGKGEGGEGGEMGGKGKEGEGRGEGGEGRGGKGREGEGEEEAREGVNEWEGGEAAIDGALSGRMQQILRIELTFYWEVLQFLHTLLWYTSCLRRNA